MIIAKQLIFAFSLSLCLSACSWNEYFVIGNKSESELIVQYMVSDTKNGFPIFTNHPSLYKLKSSGEIDWNAKLNLLDLDTSLNYFKFKVPVNSALIFGELSNDHYTGYAQNFINDRHFNLNNLEIIQSDDTVFIKPNTFDSYFKKTKGYILFELK